MTRDLSTACLHHIPLCHAKLFLRFLIDYHVISGYVQYYDELSLRRVDLCVLFFVICRMKLHSSDLQLEDPCEDGRLNYFFMLLYYDCRSIYSFCRILPCEGTSDSAGFGGFVSRYAISCVSIHILYHTYYFMCPHSCTLPCEDTAEQFTNGYLVSRCAVLRFFIETL